MEVDDSMVLAALPLQNKKKRKAFSYWQFYLSAEGNSVASDKESQTTGGQVAKNTFESCLQVNDVTAETHLEK